MPSFLYQYQHGGGNHGGDYITCTDVMRKTNRLVHASIIVSKFHSNCLSKSNRISVTRMTIHLVPRGAGI